MKLNNQIWFIFQKMAVNVTRHEDCENVLFPKKIESIS